MVTSDGSLLEWTSTSYTYASTLARSQLVAPGSLSEGEKHAFGQVRLAYRQFMPYSFRTTAQDLVHSYNAFDHTTRQFRSPAHFDPGVRVSDEFEPMQTIGRP